MDNVIHVDFARKKPLNVPRDAEKLKIFSQLLDKGVTMIILDARREGVCVPSALAGELDLRLNFSHQYGVKDFAYDEQGVSATLSFPEGFFFCQIPWPSVFAIQSTPSNSHVVWPEDVPKELQ